MFHGDVFVIVELLSCLMTRCDGAVHVVSIDHVDVTHVEPTTRVGLVSHAELMVCVGLTARVGYLG